MLGYIYSDVNIKNGHRSKYSVEEATFAVTALSGGKDSVTIEVGEVTLEVRPPGAVAFLRIACLLLYQENLEFN